MPDSSSYVGATADAYDAVAVLYTEFVAGILDDAALDRATLAAFAELVRASGNPAAVEVGCGPGHMTAHLRDLGLDAFGLDIAPAMIDIARGAHPEIRFDLSSMDAVAVPDASLGGVLSWYSLIHTPPAELRPYLEEFHRVLAPGGLLLLGFFAADGPDPVPFDHRVAPAYRWSLDALAARVTEAGFTEVERSLREPAENERHRQGRLLLRRT
ncbi:class I SAM-dependent methyltransferase [Actinomadura logoneensis]|uniref:Class I SAM-dependent methyltransferase n=1 Tax=Actinomadura logoneensis TaxID=2293572 RepID=A0A372JTC9_9ACTN|nr:class I SAM-dependent methyltransferase [Actinomadura logoneensis]RFU42608.1 class I SAM-dependent methyltransferase [Actinomadura logoneensis]